VEPLVDYLSRVARYDWWAVAIELLLIGFVVYWLVDFLEGTRGERLFRGVIFILIAGFLILKLVVGGLGFERLQYLYSGFLIFVLIIAVAAFQPEGEPRFLTGSAQQLAKIVDEIVVAVTQLSARKTGAIIVVERRVALGEFVETGVRINAKLSVELLRTIFHPGSALHDMAVIIRGDRVIAARVQLPLAEAGGTDDFELGSRHRAAMGITLGSDAVCLVVSEETGTISLAQDGKLTREVNESRLREYLTGVMGETVTPTLAGLVEWLRKAPQKQAVQPESEKATKDV
jgi:diadenylate cyclase